ncbi:nuclear transport factor 2 family protein [Pedobacter sp. SL55]|uniref:nuclear transport factor 2 family protein n=1 Tax=Pedobacter sp. SL55 TaxID=2995161 RepID=UPI002271B036|nr:nuclear transport factor 2 family protein [Pedobacter sp. SL55]WAC40341.1 nuclear transport factor 2 family protein [Pedobacter sp. SL55]
MKKIILALLLMSSSIVYAQTKDEQNLVAAVDKLKNAMISGERTALEEVAATNLSYGHSGGKVEDKAAFVESIASGKSDFVTIDLKNQTIKVTGKTAIVRHELHATTNDGGKAGEVHLGIMLVWQKEGKDWKLLARQAYKLPY